MESREVVFRLSEEMYNKFVDIKERSESLTKEEALCNAMNLYGWYLKNASEGHDIYLHSDKLYMITFDFCGENSTTLSESIEMTDVEPQIDQLPNKIDLKLRMFIIAVFLIIDIFLLKG